MLSPPTNPCAPEVWGLLASIYAALPAASLAELCCALTIDWVCFTEALSQRDILITTFSGTLLSEVQILKVINLAVFLDFLTIFELPLSIAQPDAYGLLYTLQLSPGIFSLSGIMLCIPAAANKAIMNASS